MSSAKVTYMGTFSTVCWGREQMKATLVRCAPAPFPSGCMCSQDTWSRRSAWEILIRKAYLPIFKINKYKTPYFCVFSESSPHHLEFMISPGWSQWILSSAFSWGKWISKWNARIEGLFLPAGNTDGKGCHWNIFHDLSGVPRRGPSEPQGGRV